MYGHFFLIIFIVIHFLYLYCAEIIAESVLYSNESRSFYSMSHFHAISTFDVKRTACFVDLI